jgi:hypothetical protein
MLKAAESTFDIALKARYRIIAVVGLFDKGKTFLINKLLGVNLPSGKLVATKGLSFLHIKEKRMLIVDSASVQAAVSHRAKATPGQDIKVAPCTSTVDAQTTESLLFEMISRIAHHLIFVVNDLTWFEQKYISMLHQKYVQAGQSKELMVVHNLRSTSTISEARELFEKQITSCYDGEPSHLGELIFHADQGDGVPPVHHWGLCNDGSAAGEFFNDRNFNNLMQKLEIGDALGSNIVLSDLLSSEIQRLMPIFVNIERADDGTDTMDGNDSMNQQIEVQYTPAEEGVLASEDGYQVAGSVELKPPYGSHLAIKKHGVVNSLGEVMAHDVSFDPLVNVFDRVIDNQVHRTIQVECPRVTDDQIEWEEIPNGVKVTIRKPKAFDEATIKKVYPIHSTYGVWEKEFAFPREEGHFNFFQDASRLEHGVLTLVLKAVKARKGRLPPTQQSTQCTTTYTNC